ncbi:HEXXH motif domain-containing protein [Amycolatopsis mediterranei]|uniref:HEXXH motif domain-containing protein n=1 Tax=Amycolatopsis mediterranei TaxID=33910 RepID=UPI0034183F6D
MVDFAELARGTGGAPVVHRLRKSERSRRLLLLRAVTDIAAKKSDLPGPLPDPEQAWELLSRVQGAAPDVLDLVLAHPYTGSWLGYTSRLLHRQVAGVCPLWVHVGHIHAIAAAAAIRANMPFTTEIPVWSGNAALPGLGVARLSGDELHSVAQVRCDRSGREIRGGTSTVVLPADLSSDAPGWWGVRQLTLRAATKTLALRLDDVDPYRGSYEPILPQRLPATEVREWAVLLDEAWQLITRCLPHEADALQAGFDSVVPRALMPFRTSSASSGEAFGSAIVARPTDPATLAAMLIHEFHHNRLSGLLHLVHLHTDDPAERFYTPWRDDPRPLGGVFQGVYAFFGVAAFWRALTEDAGYQPRGLAEFEFAYWRAATWRVLRVLQNDPELTDDGRLFLGGVAELAGPWQQEKVSAAVAAAAAAAAADHYAGWRLRHLRPDPAVVTALADAWCANEPRPPVGHLEDGLPTPVPDGRWRHARLDLVRLAITDPQGLARSWSTVPDATSADFAYADGRFPAAVQGYLAELAEDPGDPAAWAGLGLALARTDAAAAHALLRCPELVRAVHRAVQARGFACAPENLSAWIGWLDVGGQPGS